MGESACEVIAKDIDSLCAANGWEFDVALGVATNCCWQAKLTVILTPGRRDGPDRSWVTFAGGGGGPEQVLGEAWDDMRGWLAEYARPRRARRKP